MTLLTNLLTQLSNAMSSIFLLLLTVLFMRLEVFFFKQKTAYEIYRCDWSSDVCSSDL